MPLRFLTAGESHGPALSLIVEGVPAGVRVDRERIERLLRRRMQGHGRGGRMKIETDRIEFVGGIRWGRTLGSPVALLVRNRDHDNWLPAMSPEGDEPEGDEARRMTRPRPGHADLAGALKYGTHDARDVLERASARETAARSAAGAVALACLGDLGVEVTSRTAGVGDVSAAPWTDDLFDRLLALPDDAPMRCEDPDTVGAMIDAVDRARAARDSVGGTFEVIARGVPVGLGSHVHWDRRIDGRLGQALMSIQAVKAVSVGEGLEGAVRRGSEHHDEILWDPRRPGFVRPTNRAGGVEGGMTNGETVVCRGYLKPLATLPRPLRSVDLVDKGAFEAARERTDTIPIVAAGVVGEAAVGWVLADEMLRKFGGDSIEETRRNLEAYRASLERF
jgi:chorismate synthase